MTRPVLADIDRHRRLQVQAASELADAISEQSADVFHQLRTVETSATAADEITKTIRALKTYGKELPALERRLPAGRVSVALPFNNPLYSLVLYSVGAAVAGSPVSVRPSAITAEVVTKIYNTFRDPFRSLGVELFHGSGSDFLRTAIEDNAIQSLIFTGSYENLSKFRPQFPERKGLIYCGAGINPFIVDATVGNCATAITTAVDLAIRSRLYNSGQDCLCSERIYVHEELFEAFWRGLVERLKDVRHGPLSDDRAVVTELMPPVAANLRALLQENNADICRSWGGRWEGDVLSPQVLKVHPGSALLNREKFGPVFVLSSFHDESALNAALRSDFRFGATVCGSYDSAVLSTYPHVTRVTSVIEAESEDAHVPFGGRLKSGFATRGTEFRDGPILYSIETTVPVIDLVENRT